MGHSSSSTSRPKIFLTDGSSSAETFPNINQPLDAGISTIVFFTIVRYRPTVGHGMVHGVTLSFFSRDQVFGCCTKGIEVFNHRDQPLWVKHMPQKIAGAPLRLSSATDFFAVVRTGVSRGKPLLNSILSLGMAGSSGGIGWEISVMMGIEPESSSVRYRQPKNQNR